MLSLREPPEPIHISISFQIRRMAAVLFCFACFWNGQVVVSQDVDVNKLFSELRDRIQLLKTVQYDASVRVVRVEASGKESRLTYDLEFRSDGERYYSRFRLDDGEGESLDRTVAFDGDKLESLDEDVDVLQLTAIQPQSLPYQFPQPFIYIYGFAVGGDRQLDMASLNDLDVWRKFQMSVTSANRLVDEGHPGGVIRVEFSSSEGRGAVVLSNDWGLLPVRVQSETDRMDSTLLVRDTASIETNGSKVFFPVEVIDRAFDETGKLRYEYHATISPSTLKVNEPMDVSKFKIDRKRARWLDDVDGRLAGTAKIVEINPRSLSPIRLLLLLSVLLVCCGGYLIYLNARKERL